MNTVRIPWTRFFSPIPNAITSFRLLLVIPIVLFMWLGHTTLAFVCFTCAAVSDGLDGFVARSCGQETSFGRIWDPMADKFLIHALFATLLVFDLAEGVVILSVMFVTLAYDAHMTWRRLPEFKRVFVDGGGLSVPSPPTRVAKAKTVLQFCAVGGAFLSSLFPEFLKVTVISTPWATILTLPDIVIAASGCMVLTSWAVYSRMLRVPAV